MIRTWRLIGALALAGGILAAPHFSAAQSAPGWPTFHGGPTRDGAVNVSGPISEFWLNKYTLGGAVIGGPVVSGAGQVYIGDQTGTLYAFDPKVSGSSPSWTYTMGSPIGAAPGLTPDGSTVIVGADSGNVTALDTSSHSVRWTKSLDGPVRSSPVVSPDGATVYVASANGTVQAFTVSSGSSVWAKPIHLGNGSIVGSPTLNQNGSVLYVASTAGIVSAFPVGGSQPGQSSTPCYLDGPAASSPAVDQNGNVYAMSDIGTLWSWDSGCGARWNKPLGAHPLSQSTPAIGNGVVVTGNTNGNVYAWSASDGSAQWTRATGSGVRSSAAIATGNNEIYIGSGDGKLYAYNTSGAITWSSARRLGTGVGSPALASDGTVWVATDDGALYHIGNLITPPTAPPTVTPGPGPSATATPNVTATPPSPSPTPTQTVVPLTFTMKAQVAGGTRQTITVHSSPNTAVTLLIQYPNGDHHTGHVTTDASGNAVHNYTQPASKILHNKFNAFVTATAGTGAAQNTQKGQYKILFAAIDASAEPRSQKVGGVENIYVHSKAGTRLQARLTFPKHKSKTFNGKAGPKGWVHWRYVVGRGLTSGKNKTVAVTASTIGTNPKHTTATTFKIK